MKTEIEELFVLSKTIQENDTAALKLERERGLLKPKRKPKRYPGRRDHHFGETSFERVNQVRSQKSSRTTEASQCCGLHPRTRSTRPQSKKVK